ncbi:MAG: hypothetical protein LQ345_004107 [Seirophora villosa]|nr:MAG: hypothetical protein LQ345_004107 [Seirophora villosa]
MSSPTSPTSGKGGFHNARSVQKDVVRHVISDLTHIRQGRVFRSAPIVIFQRMVLGVWRRGKDGIGYSIKDVVQHVVSDLARVPQLCHQPANGCSSSDDESLTKNFGVDSDEPAKGYQRSQKRQRQRNLKLSLCPNHFKETYDPTTEDASREKKSWKGIYIWRMKNGFGLGYGKQVVVDGAIMHAEGSGPRQGKKSATAPQGPTDPRWRRLHAGQQHQLRKHLSTGYASSTAVGSAGVLGQEEKTPRPISQWSRIPQAQPAHDIIPFFSSMRRSSKMPNITQGMLVREQRKSRASTAPTNDSSNARTYADISTPDSIKRFN